MVRRVALLLLIAAPACVQVYRSVNARSLPPRTPVTVASPVKAHLVDGSTVVFERGITMDGDTVRGAGMRYGLTLRDSSAVGAVALDSVVGMEAFELATNDMQGFVMTILATAAAGVAVGALAVAIFGSCPTFYADSAGTPQLQAEGFSYSIAPIFESRDVDRLRVTRDDDGTVRLEMRNEALETHFVNHLELLEVPHASGETALVDDLNRLVVVAGEIAFRRARSRGGREVTSTLGAHDGVVYATDAPVRRSAGLGDLDDWIELSVPAPPGADTVAIVLRLRNSLLNTILLYDVMLGDAGVRALDWIGQDLKQVGPALAVAQWYQERMGMHVAVHDGREYRPVAHLRDTGPIAWKDVAIPVPVFRRDTLRIRLSFPTDNWRMDRAIIATRVRRVTPTVVPLVEVHVNGDLDSAALRSMQHADRRYLQTSPGQRVFAIFRARPAPAAQRQTFFLAAQGYYSEWLRRDWLRAPRSDRTFVPSDTALARAVDRWRLSQDSLEALFVATRIPVR